MWTPRLASFRFAASSLAVAVVCSACNLHNEGLDAPPGAVSYPQALALSREDELPDGGLDPNGGGADFLYIANTNYDLRYNGGSIQSYDLKAIGARLEQQGCRGIDPRVVTDAAVSAIDRTVYANRPDGGVSDAGVPAPLGGMDAQISLPANWNASSESPRGILCDGRDERGDGRLMDGTRPAQPDPVNAPDCCWGSADEIVSLQKKHVSIDSYASGIAVAPDNDRLYVPVESFSRLLYLDLADGVPTCGEGEGRCRRGPGLKTPDDVPSENFPGQIGKLHVGRLSDFGVDKDGQDPVVIATAHELGGFGLFVDTPSDSASVPLLEDALTGLDVRPTSLTFDPRHKLLYVTADRKRYFARVGVRVSQTDSFDGESKPRELLFVTTPVTVSGVSQPDDLRDIVLDPYDADRLWVLIRGAQQSIAVLQLDPGNVSSGARLLDEMRVGSGVSKLASFQQDGRWFVLASDYDDKTIIVYDAQTHKEAAVIRNLSGPFQMVHDPARRLVYVTDFRVSVVRVIDVAWLTQRGEPLPRIIATLGNPEFDTGALK